jgi:glycerol-3-phosphate dehydrogenase (NAD(P)+)
MRAIATLGIAGAGAWGTTLGALAAAAGRDTLIWAREADVVEAINTGHENPRFLPGVALDAGLRATGELGELGACDALLLAAPAQHLRAVAGALAPALKPGTPSVICAKGIEQDSLALMSEAVTESLPEPAIAVLSGPTFAAEVARGLPTAVTLACADAEQGAALVALLGSATFRPYLTDDVVGAQVGGAVKNVLAIACGIAQGKGLGDNARAALITRGFAEMARLGAALGARPETLTGLSGLGDLVLTCAGEQSRNMSLGIALGGGHSLSDVLARRESVAEGIATAQAVSRLAARHEVEVPICATVDAILHRGADIDTAIGALLARPFTAEAGAEPGH